MRALLLLLAILASLNVSASNKMPAEKILQVTVNEMGTVTVGRDTVNADDLAKYIQERLFKSYMGTGQMHSKIKFVKANDNVPDMVTEVILKEIQNGQQRALTELCLQKYKNFFDKIEKRKQDKLKKQFPVLFQSNFL
jgi:hypothetical protein